MIMYLLHIFSTMNLCNFDIHYWNKKAAKERAKIIRVAQTVHTYTKQIFYNICHTCILKSKLIVERSACCTDLERLAATRIHAPYSHGTRLWMLVERQPKLGCVLVSECWQEAVAL